MSNNDGALNQSNQEKYFRETFFRLMRDPVLKAVYEEYGYEPFRRSSVLDGFEDFLAKYKFAGKCCLEIGTWQGLTAIVLSRFFARVHTVDILDEPLKYELASKHNIRNVFFHTVKSNQQKVELVKTMKFDAAYVDGDHANDTFTDFELVKSAKKVLFHEYWGPQAPVVQLVDSLRNTIIDGKFALWINS